MHTRHWPALALTLALLAAPSLAGCGGDDPPARKDAEQACQILERVPAFVEPSGPTASSRSSALRNRYGAVTSLALAAADADPSYQHLADELRRPADTYARTFNAEQANKELPRARRACDPYD